MNAQLLVELSRQFYNKGWSSGTGGGITMLESSRVRKPTPDDRILVAPSGVQKERLDGGNLFVINRRGDTLYSPNDKSLKLSECTPLFLHAYQRRLAGAVIHSHSLNAMLVTLRPHQYGEKYDEYQVTGLEMIKGLRGMGCFDTLKIPIIDNTAKECDLAESMGDAMDDYPDVDAVLVRGHGLYVWGTDWKQAKTQAECLDYLFEASLRMDRMGLST